MYTLVEFKNELLAKLGSGKIWQKLLNSLVGRELVSFACYMATLIEGIYTRFFENLSPDRADFQSLCILGSIHNVGFDFFTASYITLNLDDADENYYMPFELMARTNNYTFYNVDTCYKSATLYEGMLCCSLYNGGLSGSYGGYQWREVNVYDDGMYCYMKLDQYTIAKSVKVSMIDSNGKEVPFGLDIDDSHVKLERMPDSTLAVKFDSEFISGYADCIVRYLVAGFDNSYSTNVSLVKRMTAEVVDYDADSLSNVRGSESLDIARRSLRNALSMKASIGTQYQIREYCNGFAPIYDCYPIRESNGNVKVYVRPQNENAHYDYRAIEMALNYYGEIGSSFSLEDGEKFEFDIILQKLKPTLDDYSANIKALVDGKLLYDSVVTPYFVFQDSGIDGLGCYFRCKDVSVGDNSTLTCIPKGDVTFYKNGDIVGWSRSGKLFSVLSRVLNIRKIGEDANYMQIGDTLIANYGVSESYAIDKDGYYSRLDSNYFDISNVINAYYYGSRTMVYQRGYKDLNSVSGAINSNVENYLSGTTDANAIDFQLQANVSYTKYVFADKSFAGDIYINSIRPTSVIGTSPSSISNIDYVKFIATNSPTVQPSASDTWSWYIPENSNYSTWQATPYLWAKITYQQRFNRQSIDEDIVYLCKLDPTKITSVSLEYAWNNGGSNPKNVDFTRPSFKANYGDSIFGYTKDNYIIPYNSAIGNTIRVYTRLAVEQYNSSNYTFVNEYVVYDKQRFEYDDDDNFVKNPYQTKIAETSLDKADEFENPIFVNGCYWNISLREGNNQNGVQLYLLQAKKYQKVNGGQWVEQLPFVDICTLVDTSNGFGYGVVGNNIVVISPTMDDINTLSESVYMYVIDTVGMTCYQQDNFVALSSGDYSYAISDDRVIVGSIDDNDFDVNVYELNFGKMGNQFIDVNESNYTITKAHNEETHYNLVSVDWLVQSDSQVGKVYSLGIDDYSEVSVANMIISNGTIDGRNIDFERSFVNDYCEYDTESINIVDKRYYPLLDNVVYEN